jgi:Zn-dependent protease with chaperone function
MTTSSPPLPGPNGGLIAPGLPGGRAGAVIAVDARTGDVVACVDGRAGLAEPVERRIAIASAVVEAGGASGVMLFVRDPSSADVTVYTEDRAVIATLAAARDWGEQRAVFRRIEGERRSTRVATPLFFVVLVALGVLAWRSLDAVVGLVPLAVDKQIGDFAEPQLLAQAGGPVVHDPVVTGAVRTIMARVVAAGPQPGLDVKVTVVDAPAVNAFALPGGSIVVFTGLLRDAGSADAVAGVLAHELGHVTARHGLRRLARSAGLVLVIDSLLGDVAGLLGAAREFFTLAAVNDYSREQEDAADAEGVRTLHAAGIDPHAYRDFFQRLAAAEDDDVLDGKAVAWLSTHPSHADRVAAVDAQRAALGATTLRPLDVDWAAVAQRLGRD